MPLPFAPEQIEAILFDLDGTLVDTDNAAVDKLEHRLRPLLRTRATPVARWIMMKSETPGNLLMTVLDRLHLETPLMGFTDHLRRRRGLYPAQDFRLIPGVADLFLQLPPRCKIGLVTTRTHFHINQFQARFPLIARRLAVTCGLQDTRYTKPHPEPIQLAARRLGVPIQNCIMVGDTTVDVHAARRAGAWSIAVLCGFGERPELERAGAHLILPNTADLSQIFS